MSSLTPHQVDQIESGSSSPSSPPPQRESVRQYAGSIITPIHTQGPQKDHYDVVVIGSGAGGATVAATAAESGQQVLILEEGAAYTHNEYSANFSGMTAEIMRNGGATVIMGRSPITYLEGKVVGGSTVLNGGMCWRTPDEVLDQWSTKQGLTHLSSKNMEPYFELIEEVIDARHQDVGSEGGNNLALIAC